VEEAVAVQAVAVSVVVAREMAEQAVVVAVVPG